MKFYELIIVLPLAVLVAGVICVCEPIVIMGICAGLGLMLVAAAKIYRKVTNE